MLTRFFKHIRRKPKAVRTRYAFGFATSFTAVIAVFWFANTSVFEFSSNEIVEEKTESTPFSTIIKQAKEQWANVQGSDTSEQEEGLAENTETQNLEAGSEIETKSYPTEIKLSEKDIEQIKEKENSSKSSSTSSSSTSNTSRTDTQVYREVMIATTSEKIVTEEDETVSSETNTSTN